MGREHEDAAIAQLRCGKGVRSELQNVSVPNIVKGLIRAILMITLGHR